MPIEKVKDVLMRRDGLTEDEANDAIQLFKNDLNDLVSDDEDGSSLEDAYQLIEDHFGLEPDYLDEFLQDLLLV